VLSIGSPGPTNNKQKSFPNLLTVAEAELNMGQLTQARDSLFSIILGKTEGCKTTLDKSFFLVKNETFFFNVENLIFSSFPFLSLSLV
jgi:hypothetical protein